MKETELMLGAVGVAGIPSAAMVAESGCSKKSGKLGSAMLTPP